MNYRLTERIYRRENLRYEEGVGSSFASLCSQDMIEAQIEILKKTYELALAKFNWKQKRVCYEKHISLFHCIDFISWFIGMWCKE